MTISVKVPDLGVDAAEVIELLVKPGETVKKEQPIAVLESDKASLELPAPEDGVFVSWSVAVGTSVKEGDALCVIEVAGADAASAAEKPAEAKVEVASEPKASTEPVQEAEASSAPAASAPVVDKSAEPQAPRAPTAASAAETAPSKAVHAGPAVRRLARELGVDLAALPSGQGHNGRLLKEDVHTWVKSRLSQAPASGGGSGMNFGELPPEPDYTKWGEITLTPRSRIQRKSAENLARSSLMVPQVTQFDLADITELEAFRLTQRDRFKADGLSLTMTALAAKTVAYLLREMPQFNASLSRDGESLVLKQYVNLGIAVDTPNGLMVPVLHNADRMSLREIAEQLGVLAEQARTGKLPPAAMQGASFTISSLGGIGGTAFTPLVNWPEVAILGLSRASKAPVWNGSAFEPRLQLPLSLSYDHRVIDGAAAARFTTRLAALMADIRQLLI